jgi:arsenite methyltransferase
MTPSPTATHPKPRYGIDAPGVILTFLCIGLFFLLLPLVTLTLKFGSVVIPTPPFMWTGGFFALSGLAMLTYSLVGKYYYRDRMINFIEWKGNEQVLDVGTGKGLLMIGAARRLSTGKSTGIDIWSSRDLTGNHAQAALDNALREGVADKVEVLTESVVHLSFPDNRFDVILSNLCIHNIPSRQDRDKACSEIWRTLKPGGVALISDFKNIRQYRKAFEGLGVSTTLAFRSKWLSWPPLTAIKVVKP